MRSSARLAVARDPARPGSTRITRLRSDPPLTLRPTIPAPRGLPRRWGVDGPAHAWVSMAAAAAGPLGGDHLSLEVDVGPGATLVARNVAASLVLPGGRRQRSTSEVTIVVGAGATLVWSAGPVIAARGCDHRATTHIALDPSARLLVLDELVLGRHGEGCGTISQRLRVCIGGRALYDQELRVGPRAPGAGGSAVTGGRRAIGSTLLVDAGWASEGAFEEPATDADRRTALLPLEGPGVLITGLAPDLVELRHALASQLDALDPDGPARRPTSVRAAGELQGPIRSEPAIS